jgi:Replication protein
MSKFYNRCDRLWCPLCTPRLGRERKKSVEWWTQEITQPKHVVLTARNSADLTRETVRAFKAAFARLRRSKFAKNWRGGFYSLETTNEGRGWHLHLHALIDARYIDARQLAIEWARCIGQDFAIVKVKDARDRSYLQEVTKYVVKGSDLAKWTGQEIAMLVDSFTGVRTFGVFGTLYGKRTEFREWIDALQLQSRACQCGCRNFRLLTENELLALDLTHDETRACKLDIPPPHPELLQIPAPSNYDCSC